MLTLYTDGSCSKNPGPGGWAFVAIDEWNKIIASASGFIDFETTNNRMELVAVLAGLSVLNDDEDVLIVSDSQYALGVINKIERWELAGVLHKRANSDILLQVKLQLKRLPPIKTKWIKGHSGNKYNEIVDKMARATWK